MNKFTNLAFIVSLGTMLSACSPNLSINSSLENSPTSELNQPIPTVSITAHDPADQKIIDELSQFQNPSFDQDFSNIESQL